MSNDRDDDEAKADARSTLKRASGLPFGICFMLWRYPALKRWSRNPAGKPRERGWIHRE
jgi:hypothetical protein